MCSKHVVFTGNSSDALAVGNGDVTVSPGKTVLLILAGHDVRIEVSEGRAISTLTDDKLLIKQYIEKIQHFRRWTILFSIAAFKIISKVWNSC